MTKDQAIAFSAALSSIKRDVLLPANVFRNAWDDYLFFDDWRLWDERFIEIKNLLLQEKSATTIALVNLKDDFAIDASQPAPPSSFETVFLNRGSLWDEYSRALRDERGDLGWLVLRDRYVCASDTGSWVVYCEKREDMAIFAYQSHLPGDIRSKAAALLGAKSIASPMHGGDPAVFDFSKLLPTWRDRLRMEYLPSAKPNR